VGNDQSERLVAHQPQPDGAADGQQNLSQTLNTHSRQPKPPAALSEQQEESIVLEKYGVARTDEHGLIQYRMAGSTDNRVLFETAAGTAEFAQSSHKLDELTQEKVNDLKSKYHVSFSTEGENAVRPWLASKNNPSRLVPGAMLHARAPRLSELMGIEAALQSSQPSQLVGASGQNGLKFYFLKTPTFGKHTFDAGLFAGDAKGKLSVFLEPDAQPGRPITVADAVEKHEDIKTSIEALAAHEIAHNSEWNMDLWDLEKLKPLAEQLGWTVPPDSSYWLLKGKGGEFFRLTNDGLSSDKGWIRCDEKGGALDDGGNPVADANAAPHLTNAQVQEKALVRPPTEYFTAPDEMLADSLMLLRVGEAGRKELMKSGSQLYNVVKDFDQSEIDLRFGKTADGGSEKIRLPNGNLVDNDDKSKQIIATFDHSLT
jgi:hypothetical protein